MTASLFIIILCLLWSTSAVKDHDCCTSSSQCGIGGECVLSGGSENKCGGRSWCICVNHGGCNKDHSTCTEIKKNRSRFKLSQLMDGYYCECDEGWEGDKCFEALPCTCENPCDLNKASDYDLQLLQGTSKSEASDIEDAQPFCSMKDLKETVGSHVVEAWQKCGYIPLTDQPDGTECSGGEGVCQGGICACDVGKLESLETTAPFLDSKKIVVSFDQGMDVSVVWKATDSDKIHAVANIPKGVGESLTLTSTISGDTTSIRLSSKVANAKSETKGSVGSSNELAGSSEGRDQGSSSSDILSWYRSWIVAALALGSINGDMGRVPVLLMTLPFCYFRVAGGRCVEVKTSATLEVQVPQGVDKLCVGDVCHSCVDILGSGHCWTGDVQHQVDTLENNFPRQFHGVWASGGSINCRVNAGSYTEEYGFWICEDGKVKGFEVIDMSWASSRIRPTEYYICGTWEGTKANPGAAENTVGSVDRINMKYTQYVVRPSLIKGDKYDGNTRTFFYPSDQAGIAAIDSRCGLKALKKLRETVFGDCDCRYSSGGSGSVGCGTDCDCGKCWYCDSGTCRYGGEGTYGCYRGCPWSD